MATILVVDDHPTNREFLVTLLGYRGHRLLEAADGAEALALVRDEHPDLVITDLLMPTMDGFEFVRQLRDDPAIAATPVIFFTARYHWEESRTLAQAGGVSCHLSKPSEPEEILRTVDEILGSTPPFVPPPVTEAFDREHLRLLSDMLARKADQLETVNLRLSALIELSQQLILERNPSQLIEKYGRGAREIIGTKFAGIAVGSGDGRTVRHFTTCGLDAETVARIGAPPAGLVNLDVLVRTGRHLRNLIADPEVVDFLERHPALNSWLCVPIASPSRRYGTLYLADKLGTDEFSEADERMAVSLAAQVAVAYENAQQHEEIRRRTAQLEQENAERLRAEHDLEAAKETAEAANRAKDQFLAILSHELRTPLTPVLAIVSAMLDDPEPPADLRPILQLIRRSIELEARLIDDLLDFSRIVHGKLHLNFSVVDAHALVHQTLALTGSDLAGKRMRLDLDLSATDPYINADPVRLQQVFWNLIRNAVKFSPPGATMAIRSRNEPDPDGGQLLVVEVADSGIGIEPEVLPRIFDAFVQGEDTLTRRFGGLGLGLAICRSVVEAHGGRLMAASSGQGQGATFTMELKVEDASTHPDRPPSSHIRSTAPSQALRILLVEDDRPTLRVLARLLQRCQHEVTTAETSASALEIGERQDFDLVISDIGLPDGSGLELMRRLRACRPVKGIALTGFGMDEDLERSREAGFVAHLTKPVNFKKLEMMIQQVALAPMSP